MSTIEAHPGGKGVKAVVPAGPRGHSIKSVSYDSETGEATFILEDSTELDPVPLVAPFPEAPDLEADDDLYSPTLTVTRAGSPREEKHKLYRSDDGDAFSEVAEKAVEDEDVEHTDDIPPGVALAKYVATTLDASNESKYSPVVEVDRSEILVHDSFTDSDGVLLQNHTPERDEEGGGWTIEEGTWEIQGGRLRQTTTSNPDFAEVDAGTPSVDLEVTLYVDTGSGVTIGPTLRRQDATNFYRVFFGGHMYLQRRDADGWHAFWDEDLKPVYTDGDPLRVRLIYQSEGADALYLSFVDPATDERRIIYARDAAPTASSATKHGLWVADGDGTANGEWDDFTVRDASKSVTPSLSDWDWYRIDANSPIISAAPSGEHIREIGNVLYDPNDTSDYRYKVFVSRKDESTGDVVIDMYHGSDLKNLSAYSSNPIISSYAEDPYVVIDPASGDYWLFCEDNSTNDQVARHSSSDRGRTWTRDGALNLTDAASPVVWRESGGTWHMLYEQYPTDPKAIMHATSTGNALGDWQDNSGNPMLLAGDVDWISSDDIVPDEIVRKDGKYYVFFHAAGGYYDAGMAVATDITDKTTWEPYDEHTNANNTMPFIHPETGDLKALIYGHDSVDEPMGGFGWTEEVVYLGTLVSFD